MDFTPDGDVDDAYAEGDRALDDFTHDELGELEQLAAEVGAVTDKVSALAFYDRLAGHG